ncbi:uncharacterized protein LOC126724966 isoform X1 [Quercus robur]|uniref:uncharacterized protein LOC126724966 isoform X1 n=1 Tax=Quercus robur TaxID=38942 RepID=UPI002162E7F9|nr:uncharacterized protein LOC126724966 isoform X1 [Quercus robur]
MDALEQLHPIEVEVPRARSIGELFDSISYKRDLLSLECCRVILVWHISGGMVHVLDLKCWRESLNALLREVFHKTLKEAIQRFQTLLNDRNTYLLSMDTRKVQDQDIIFVLFLISSEGREVAWRWLKVCTSWSASS